MAYAQLSTRLTHGLHPNLRGLGFLGDTPGISMAEAVRQAVANEGGRDINPKDAPGFDPNNPNWSGLLPTGIINPAGYSPTCATQAAPNVNLFQTASGMALGTTSAGVGILAATHMIAASAIPVVGAVIAGIAAVVTILDVVFAHHAAAARQEQQLGCAAIAAWNNSITLIRKAVQDGTMYPADAAAAMDQLYAKVQPFLAPSDSHSPYCSAVCELLIGMDAVRIYQKSQFEALATQQGSQATQLQQQAARLAPTTGVPSWVWLAGLGFLAWQFL